MSDETLSRTNRGDLSGRQKRGRNVLAVRMLVARLAWLEAPLRWHGGKVVWETAEQPVAPGPRELSRAQRTLNRLAEYPHSAKAALGDPEAWRSACQSRIELTKRLSSLQAPDLAELVQPGRLREPANLARLAALLPAEALCRSGMPASPAAALVQAGPAAEAPVLTSLVDEQAPVAARTLAALVLGALRRGRSGPGAGAPGREAPPALRRAYAWGQAHGLPPDPWLASCLLGHEAGHGHLARLLAAPSTASVLALPGTLVRELLAGGETPERVVRLVEVAAATERLSERLLRRPVVEEEQAHFLTVTNAENRREAAWAVAELFHTHAWESRDPEALVEISRWVDRMLDLLPLFPALTDNIRLILDSARSLPAEQRAGFFRLLADRYEQLWPSKLFIVSFHRRYPNRELGRLHSQLQQRWHTEVLPLLSLCRKVGDLEAVSEAFDFGIHGCLDQWEWPSPELFRLTLELARQMETTVESYVCRSTYRLLHRLPDVRAARRVVRALVEVLPAFEPESRAPAVDDLCDYAGEDRKELETRLLRMIAFLPRYAEWARTDTQDYKPRRDLISLAHDFHTRAPERADARLAWLLVFLTERALRHERDWDEIYAMSGGASLAFSLAGADDALFQSLVRSALEHGKQVSWYVVERALPQFERFPGLKTAFARLLPLQFGRCIQLLINLHLTARYGPGALAALEKVFGATATAAPPEPVPDAWRTVLAAAPKLTAAVSDWTGITSALEQSADPPPGIARVLALPERLRKELGHLEERLAREPERADLRSRAETLRARLAAPEKLVEQIRMEVSERLEIALAEARLRLAERRLDDCHRDRLEELAGPLPGEFRLTDDLRNAALLSADISTNRKHLRRLLRAHMAGDRGWREAHPANAALLRNLSERGVDTGYWLGEHPREHAWAGLPGGKVRLWLEQDPIRILQMGNYFETCLSLGNCNAFSTVTNASELNKRVIYAADGKGRIVGRKLIAINGEGRLVGFRTYTSCTDTRQNEQLGRVFRRYCEEFARRCGLELDDQGDVPRLFTAEWYNDGIVPWDDEETNGPGSSSTR